jgi:hypothetical protein
MFTEPLGYLNVARISMYSNVRWVNDMCVSTLLVHNKVC